MPLKVIITRNFEQMNEVGAGLDDSTIENAVKDGHFASRDEARPLRSQWRQNWFIRPGR